MSSIPHTYLRLLKGLLVVLALLMVVLVFANFVLRYAFASGLAVSDELSRWALVWVGFIGATVALSERRHLAMLGVVRALPPRAARVVLLLAQLACLAASVFFLIGAWRQVLLNMNMSAPACSSPCTRCPSSPGRCCRRCAPKPHAGKRAEGEMEPPRSLRSLPPKGAVSAFGTVGRY